MWHLLQRSTYCSAGHYADLIAVDGAPLSDVSELERVRWVMKGRFEVMGAR